jgi:probable rRNA maturation factor
MNESPNESKRAQVSNLCPKLIVDDQEVDRLFATLDRFGSFDPPPGELSIAFVSKAEISRIHEQFMNDRAPTDVITFPADSENGLAGEICVCPEIAFEYGRENGIQFSDELSLYLIHGYLHLCGFDDRSDGTRTEMRIAEDTAMNLAQSHGALPVFKLEEDVEWI